MAKEYIEVCSRDHGPNEGCDHIHLSVRDFDKVCQFVRPFWAYSPDADRYVRCVKSRFDVTLHGCGRVKVGLADASEVKVTEEGDLRMIAKGEAI